jgi:hypothetical protein
VLAAAAAVAIVAIVVLVGERSGPPASPRSAGSDVPCDDEWPSANPPAQFVRGDVSGSGCFEVGVYANQVLTIRLRPGDPALRRFALGLPGDRLFLGDWNCDGVATPELFRPATNATLYYESWSANAKPSDDEHRCRSIG